MIKVETLDQLLNILDQKQKVGDWEYVSTATEKEIEKAESFLSVHFPEPYRTFLKKVNGAAYEHGVNFQLSDTDNLLECNDISQCDWTEDLPGMIVFAHDDGRYWHFDPANKLGHGQWAIYANFKSAGDLGACILEAPNFLAFMELLLNDVELPNGEFLDSLGPLPDLMVDKA